MVAFSKINPGDVLYDCRMVKQGNTTIKKMACWTVKIIEVNENGTALVSWNSNRAQIYRESQINRLRRTPKK